MQVCTAALNDSSLAPTIHDTSGIFRGTVAVHCSMCDLDKNRRDIERLLDEHPEVTTVYRGHCGPLPRAEVEALLERWPTP